MKVDQDNSQILLQQQIRPQDILSTNFSYFQSNFQNYQDLKKLTDKEKIKNQMQQQCIVVEEMQESQQLNKQIYNRQILRYTIIRDKLKKVNKLPKHYIRQFIKHYECFQKQCNWYQLNCIKNLKKNLSYRLQRGNIKLIDIRKLLQKNNKLSQSLAKKNRYILSKILRGNKCKFTKQQNTLSYMIANKIFALRCRNSILIQRNQII